MREPILVPAQIMTVARTDKGTAVLVKPTDLEKAVPIFIGALEAQSILIGMGKVPMPRPLTHDLMVNLMEKAKVTLVQVEINGFQADTFYAQLICRAGVRKLILDCRPSDALALVARLEVPLFIAKSIVDEVGIPVSMIMEDQHPLVERAGADEEEGQEGIAEEEVGEGPPESSYLRALNLQQDLEAALENEDYEEAARLRDELKNLGHQSRE